MVRPRSAKPLLPSSNLGGASSDTKPFGAWYFLLLANTDIIFFLLSDNYAFFRLLNTLHTNEQIIVINKDIMMSRYFSIYIGSEVDVYIIVGPSAPPMIAID